MTDIGKDLNEAVGAVIGSIQDLDEAMEVFKANPSTRNQSVLERAMRVYQSNVTAVEPAEKRLNHDGKGPCSTCGNRVSHKRNCATRSKLTLTARPPGTPSTRSPSTWTT